MNFCSGKCTSDEKLEWRRGTLTRSLRFAKARMTRLTKRLARSADDLDAIEKRRPEDPVRFEGLEVKERSKSVAVIQQKDVTPEPKFAISNKNEFDYNSALELEYEGWKKSHGRTCSAIDLSDSIRQKEDPGKVRNLSFSVSISEIMGKRKNSKKSSISSSSSTPQYDSARRRSTDIVRKGKEILSTGVLKKMPICRVALVPLNSEQFVQGTRRTLILDAHPERCECIITDNDDGEIQFSCVLSQDGIVCRNHKTMLDIVSIGKLSQLSQDEPLGVYYTIEGCRDGQIAKIRKGRSFSFKRIKYHLNLVTDADRRMLLSLPGSPHSPKSDAPLPVLKQSLLVIRHRRNILKIVTKTNKIAIACLQKEMNSQRYWLHLEPNVDSCFVAAIASYILRKRIFGDRLPKALKRGNIFARRARRLSFSFRRKRPARRQTSAPTSSSIR